MRVALVMLSLAMVQVMRAAAPVTFASGAAHVALVELFTSEGCSSCPPAERWLAAQANDAGLWQTFVPVSWHVDYWNRLGWPDRFSRRSFTDRQYAYANAWRAGNVYTPCFVRDGGEWRPREGLASASLRRVGVLTAHYDGTAVRADFAPADPALKTTNLELHVVLLGGGIRSKVTAGENRGETLAHEFVALAEANGPVTGPVPLAKSITAGVGRYALAVWITRRGELEPLQATGGWLPNP